ncbi:GIY-YIG nuclease family protein [Trueperella pyogenes]|uniref:GIY-YIG nuclease family protein n=1 Tax=Trueperella pyogenes TaxID=1661 RepID=UPI0032502225
MSIENQPSMGPADEFLAHLLADDSGLLDEEKKPEKITPQGRLERSFLEIVEFVEREGREPSSSTRVIAERKLGARLDGLRANEQKIEKLTVLDRLGLLAAPEQPEEISLDDMIENDDFGLLDDEDGFYDLSSLPAVKRTAETPESIAKRKRAQGFDQFEHLFKQKHAELQDGTARLIEFPGAYSVRVGQFFVLKGVMLFVAEVGQAYYAETGGRPRRRERLRVIFENGTESDLYRQSLSTRLHEEGGLAVIAPDTTLEEIVEGDIPSGTIYVLESLSTDPEVRGIRDLHKIGFTTTTVEKRIAGAEKSPTYLMAPVKVVDVYRVYNMRTSALEHLLHRVFGSVRVDIRQMGISGESAQPSEWFIVPREVIAEAVDLVVTGDIVDYEYDKAIQALVKRRG